MHAGSKDSLIKSSIRYSPCNRDSSFLAMEILGGAASVFAAVSVADQLATRVKQLYDFWSAVSDAPDNVRALAAGLIPLLKILTQISNDGQKYGQDNGITEILEQCREIMGNIISLSANIKRRCPSYHPHETYRRTGSRIFVLKQEAAKVECYQSGFQGRKIFPHSGMNWQI